jgi:heme o synthase
MSRNRFATFAWVVLGYSVLVILWGAFVRISLSGDGCGSHWPLCDGVFIPMDWTSERMVEFIHRATSGLFGLFTLVLLIWAFKKYPKGSPIRTAVTVGFIFTMFEAIIGAVLVRYGWVAQDTSWERAVMQVVHLVNTFFLLAGFALAAMWASGLPQPRLRGQGPVLWGMGIGLLGLLFLGASGAVTALGDLLFPVTTSSQAVIDSLDPTRHFLVRLRVLHPMIAVSVGLYLVLLAGLLSYFRPSPVVKQAANWVIGIFAVQVLVGLLNVLFKAPLFMQLTHLLLADANWVAALALCAGAVAVGVERVELVRSAEVPSEMAKAGWKDYLVLTKPRVISLLLFTTLTAMFVAKGGWPGLTLFLAVAVGGYLMAGAANAINMVVDRDIDGAMKRTSVRPTVTQKISSTNAMAFSFALAAGSFVILWSFANLLAAALALAGLAFYVVVYTLLLKRRTWHNIVIGGAAGAFPPLVGWASVTNELSALAWILFAIIFVWTPVHFWALALLIKDDYAKANVPMLPVVHGERATVIQIVCYAIATAVVSLLPFLQPNVGWGYLGMAILLNTILMIRCVQLAVRTDRPRAVSLYKFSMLYLAVLFLALAVERSAFV